MSGLHLARWSVERLAAAAPGADTRLAWLELRNKLEAFSLFRRGAAATGGSLASRVAAAAMLGPYASVWHVEGLGFGHAEAEWRSGAPLRGLLAPRRTGDLPSASWIALHAGLGLALASRVLQTLEPRASGARLRGALARFTGLCRDNALPGYGEVAFEALGLAARTLRPSLVAAIDRELPGFEPGLAAWFWHGVGRGAYFSPLNAPPVMSMPWRVLSEARERAAHATGRANAVAGVLWALTLVNLRQPEVLEAFLRHHGGWLDVAGVDRAMAGGVASALVAWRELAPDDPAPDAFLRHRPGESDPGIAQLWQGLVAGPAAAALRRHGPGLPGLRPAELFRCRPDAEVEL